MTWNGKQFDWTNVVYFAVVHVGAVVAPCGPSPGPAWPCSPRSCWVAFSVGIGVTYHRLLTHRGYTVPKPLEYLLTVCGMLASEGGAISWVAMHRMHHTLSDRPGKDLHTPKDGFLWSHIGWILTKIGADMREIEKRYAPELVADPVHRVLNRLHVFPNILVGLGALRLGRLAAGGVGRVPAPGGRPARHLVRELGRPHLGLPHVRHARGLDQPLVGGPHRLGRGLAQQPPRLPAQRAPRPRVVGDRRELVGHPRPARAGPGPRRPAPARRARSSSAWRLAAAPRPRRAPVA